MKEIQGNRLWFELAKVRVFGGQLYIENDLSEGK